MAGARQELQRLSGVQRNPLARSRAPDQALGAPPSPAASRKSTPPRSGDARAAPQKNIAPGAVQVTPYTQL